MTDSTGTENSGTSDNSNPTTEPGNEKPVETAKPKAKKASGKKASKPAAKKAKAVKVSKAAPKSEKAATKTPKAAPVATTDRQLPKVGTVIEKKDRAGNVRCKCQVVVGGILYKGKVYGSLSAAAMAAAADLGLGSTTLNGWLFWGLIQSAPAVDPVEAIQKLSARMIERVKSTMAGTDEDEQKQVEKAVREHLTALTKLVK